MMIPGVGYCMRPVPHDGRLRARVLLVEVGLRIVRVRDDDVQGWIVEKLVD
jgi:hypothetical protein